MAIHEKKVFGLPYTRQSQYQKEDGGFDYAKILYAPDGSDLADFILRVQPKVVLPIHQEKFSWDILEEVARQCHARFTAAGNEIRFFL